MPQTLLSLMFDTSPSVTEFSLRHSEVNNTFAIVLKEAGIKNYHKGQKSESRV